MRSLTMATSDSRTKALRVLMVTLMLLMALFPYAKHNAML
ncbi:hypothetical protein UUU_28250 [Klebsiella pneumoniae subsp. pneumoniae DSM 30104 = JCM 1662 = NBRC 14940]|nr:hypothetical protein UUU_28250 [Klebsiella pneumoniae subsp. pneumoniae DSM 30104 = JCM 1662 = NBRC 14940]